MKKLILSLVFVIGLILLTGIFATAKDISQEVSDVLGNVSDSKIATNVQKYVEDFVEKRGIEPKDVTNVDSVDLKKLPKDIKIENVDDSNLAIYGVNYSVNSNPKQLFVITYSTETLKSYGDLVVAHDKRQFLNFGFGGSTSDTFLMTSTGVLSSLDRGYVMMREGSITGITTSLGSSNSTLGFVEVVIYKNGQKLNFGNKLYVKKGEVSIDYDLISSGTLQFNAGDVISVFLKTSDGLTVSDVSTLVEITTN